MKQDDMDWVGPEPFGSARAVYLGILQDIEAGRMVPGQRVVETDLSVGYQVGRNAVREAIQHLAVRGVIDLSPNRSPAIRRLDLVESLEVLDVAAAMTKLAARAAAAGYCDDHAAMLDRAITDYEAIEDHADPSDFSRARRGFYRALLLIGGNRELHRLFPAIGMHIIHAQYPLPQLREIRRRDYRAIADAIQTRDGEAAEQAAATHVEHVRAAILAANQR